ncbi:T9SS type A sorting domain-containing protein, partial [Flavobacterium sp.]|uniref:T9SS type A sorting domain-containing protein n=1 Tax=Flavobacterium sp. TaxID=239 RepID=UPI0026327828
VFTIGANVSLIPNVSGGTVTSYSVSPALPLGLNFDTTTGEIFGTPTAISNGIYTVTAMNSGGSTSFDVEITVDNPLNNNQNDFENITVYPNPFEEVIHINGNINGVSYQVFSIDGKLIQKDKLLNNDIEFRDLPTGVYLLQLFYQEKVQTLKIIKQ